MFMRRERHTQGRMNDVAAIRADGADDEITDASELFDTALKRAGRVLVTH